MPVFPASKKSLTALSCALLCSVVFAHIALADGLPGEKAAEVKTPLDQALEDIQNKEPPVALAPAPPAPEPVLPAPEPAPQPAPPPPAPVNRVVEVQPNAAFFGLSVGTYDITHGENAVSFNFEWQPSVKIAGVLQPIFGALATTNGALMGYGGIGVPFHLTQRIRLMPSVAVGAYEKGDGYDLDRRIAYRLGAELAYIFDNQSRIGLNAHVLTNARSFNREDRTEVIGLAYTIPLNAMTGLKSTPASQQPAPAYNR